MKRYDIEPAPAPRQVKSDTWKPRPQVKRYRAFRDEVRIRNVRVPHEGARVTFILPMPASWTRTKRAKQDGQPHRQKPDVDNLLKALLDAVYADDAGVHDIAARKVWGEKGQILIEDAPT